MSTKPPAAGSQLRIYEIELPQGIQFSAEGNKISAQGPAGRVERIFPTKNIGIKVEGNKIFIQPKDKTAFTRMIAGAFNAHVKNMVAGSQKQFTYKLKIAFVHFPITVSVSGSEFSVQNFLGERKPRKAKLPANVKVSVQGDIIIIESPDLESAGKAATLIEQTTRIRSRDRRVFQDGIYITQKPE